MDYYSKRLSTNQRRAIEKDSSGEAEASLRRLIKHSDHLFAIAGAARTVGLDNLAFDLEVTATSIGIEATMVGGSIEHMWNKLMADQRNTIGIALETALKLSESKKE